MRLPRKTRNRIATQVNNPTSGHLAKGTQKSMWKMCLFQHYPQWAMEST